MKAKWAEHREGIVGLDNAIYAPPFDKRWNERAMEKYSTRYGPLESPKVRDSSHEELYMSLFEQNRSIYEEYKRLRLDRYATTTTFYTFLKNVVHKVSFEGESLRDPKIYPASEKRKLEILRAQRQFYRLQNTTYPYNVWGNVSHQADKLFEPAKQVDLRRRIALSAIGSTPKSLVFFLLQRYAAVLESSPFIDNLREAGSFPVIERIFYEQCVRDIAARRSYDRPSMQFIVERITDTHEAHYYYLIHLRESRTRALPEYCEFQEDKLYEDLSDKERARLVCSHTIFRDFYLAALVNMLPIRAAKCFDHAVKLYHDWRISNQGRVGARNF